MKWSLSGLILWMVGFDFAPALCYGKQIFLDDMTGAERSGSYRTLGTEKTECLIRTLQMVPG